MYAHRDRWSDRPGIAHGMSILHQISPWTSAVNLLLNCTLHQLHLPPPSLIHYTNRLFGHQRRYAKRRTERGRHRRANVHKTTVHLHQSATGTTPRLGTAPTKLHHSLQNKTSQCIAFSFKRQLETHLSVPALDYTIRYDTRCYFNVRSKADMSQHILPHGNDNLKV